jgi:hypothetical protein
MARLPALGLRVVFAGRRRIDRAEQDLQRRVGVVFVKLGYADWDWVLCSSVSGSCGVLFSFRVLILELNLSKRKPLSS